MGIASIRIPDIRQVGRAVQLGFEGIGLSCAIAQGQIGAGVVSPDPKFSEGTCGLQRGGFPREGEIGTQCDIADAAQFQGRAGPDAARKFPAPGGGQAIGESACELIAPGADPAAGLQSGGEVQTGGDFGAACQVVRGHRAFQHPPGIKQFSRAGAAGFPEEIVSESPDIAGLIQRQGVLRPCGNPGRIRDIGGCVIFDERGHYYISGGSGVVGQPAEVLISPTVNGTIATKSQQKLRTRRQITRDFKGGRSGKTADRADPSLGLEIHVPCDRNSAPGNDWKIVDCGFSTGHGIADHRPTRGTGDGDRKHGQRGAFHGKEYRRRDRLRPQHRSRDNQQTSGGSQRIWECDTVIGGTGEHCDLCYERLSDGAIIMLGKHQS